MKKICVLFLFISTLTMAQKQEGFGIKGGVNYSANGVYYQFFEPDELPDRNIGYHIGVFTKVDVGLLYFRPEVLYTRTQSEYSRGSLIINKVDVPLLVGATFFDVVDLFAGPSFQYIADSKFKNGGSLLPENDLTLVAQFGLGFNFKKFGVDLRYERGFNENEVSLRSLGGASIDLRPDQFILGLSAILF